MELHNKTILITGASRGIGAAIARLFAAEGAAKLALNYFESDDYEPDAKQNVEALAKELGDRGVQVTAIEADVSSEPDVVRMLKEAIDFLGRIDVLVNNAGIVFDLPIAERSIDQWNRTIDTNLKGTYMVLHHAAEHLKSNPGSKVINMASTSGLDVLSPESIDYDASKVGIISLTKNFAQDLAPGTNVNAIAPGWVDTEMNKDLPKDFVDKEIAKIALDRFATPDEMAQVAVFLASDRSRYVNGAVIIADGGRKH